MEGERPTACLQIVGGGSCSTPPYIENSALKLLAEVATQPLSLIKEVTTPSSSRDQLEEKKEQGDDKGPIKKLASDPDFSTPKSREGQTNGIYSASFVKRRLNFENEAMLMMREGSSSGDSWAVSNPACLGGEGEDGDVEDNHPPYSEHHVKKKRKRSSGTKQHYHHHHKVLQVLGQDCQPTRQIIAGCSTSAYGEGKKEEESGGGESKENKGPPRKIAQLVVWTKPSASKEKETGKAEGAIKEPSGRQKKVGAAIKTVQEPVKEPEQATAAAKSSSAEGEKEGDLFFVQYPARPFSDQGKGKGKPFRRLNSYNDPIVVKKTPPPPPPSQGKRRKAGEKRKRGVGGGRKSKEHQQKQQQTQQQIVPQVVVDPSAVAAAAGLFEQQQAAYRAYLEHYSAHTLATQQLPDYNVAQVWPDQHQQYIAHVEAHPQFVEEFYGCTIPLAGGGVGELITLPLQAPPQEGGTVEVIVPSEFSNISHPPEAVPIAQEEVPVAGKEEVVSTLEQEVEEKSAVKQEEMGEGASGGASGENTVFELPDRFTVTTEGQNEFDLLIQNVVHEELVNGGGPLEDDERGRKRMRLEGEDPLGVAADEEGVSSGGEERCGGGSGGGSEEGGKPRCTYTELIEKALTESGGLTVSEIYNWISERYPYYKQDDDRWKNSVRHNLSINPYFKKGEKARSGAGHLWTISEESKGLRPSMVSGWDERRKSPCDPGELLLSMDNETDRAVANILGMYRSKMEAEKGAKEASDGDLCTPPPPPNLEKQAEENTVAATEVQPTPISTSDSYCPTTTSAAVTSTNAPTPVPSSMITLNQLNAGQFTVDLSGITIPEGGTINFDELVSNGRLIYIETTTQDPEANKENEHLLHHHTDSLLSELTSGTSGGHNVAVSGTGVGTLGVEDPNRFISSGGGGYFQDLDIAFGTGKGDPHGLHHFGCPDDSVVGCSDFTTTSSGSTTTSSALTMVAPSDVVPVSSSVSSEYAMLDQVLHPLTTTTSSGGGYNDTGLLSSCVTSVSSEIGDHHQHNHHHLQVSTSLSSSHDQHSLTPAMYESKELGIPYTFQTENSHQQQQQMHPHLHLQSHSMHQHPDLLQ